MRVAVVHDWLTGMRGGEKVLEGLLSLYPDADVFTLLHLPGSVSPAIESHRIHTSFLQRFPALRRHYRKYLLLFPRAAESFDLSGFDLVISSSHCVAKGVRVPPGVPHVCYCHTPMRYIWDRYDDYFGPGRASPPVRAVMSRSVDRLRRWDVDTAGGVSVFVANSAYVADRIERLYGRPAHVVHPWVDHEQYTPGPSTAPNTFFMLTALVPYKRVDVAIEAFRELPHQLVIAGSGPERARLDAMAGPNVTFLGPIDDDALRDRYRGCRALLFPGEEDFGIVPLEAMACGRPVIAYDAGGARETVVPGVTGEFYTPQGASALARAVARFDPARYDAARISAHARTFDRARSLQQFHDIVTDALHAAAAGAAPGHAHGTH